MSIYETTIKNPKKIAEFYKQLSEQKDIEIIQLKKQLEYIRSGEYYNQLRFERDMLQNIVDNGEVSKEDREFIDCTHRNSELLEEKQELIDCLKEEINEAKESWGNCVYYNNEKGMFEVQIEIRLLEKILSKIEKSDK